MRLMKMASSVPHCRSLLSFCLLLLFLHSSAVVTNDVMLTYNGGPVLSGNLDLSLVWYGQFGRIQKHVLRSFIKSLNGRAVGKLNPLVSQWWNVVESYQEAARKPAAPINVKVVKQVVDASYSMGKVITIDFIDALIKKAMDGSPNAIPVIIAAKDVTVQGICQGKCAVHAVHDKRPYLLLADPTMECPGACAWPFVKSDYGPPGKISIPPNGNIAADVLVISFATALAEAVTNPFQDGFYQRNGMQIVEAGMACQGIFGSGATPGNTGKVLVDPVKGASYNAFGARGKKFLVPGIWNPKTKKCFTLM